MPIHLYHGPASLEKQRRFQGLLSEDFANTLTLTANAAMANWLRQNRFEAQNDTTHFGNTVLSFQEFLFQTLKKNRHRAHAADTTLCESLLALLGTRSGTFTNPNSLATQIRDTHAFFTQIKKSPVGLNPKPQFGLPLANPKIFELYSAYTAELTERHFYDAGDVYRILLLDLHQNKLRWVWPFTRVILYGIYPLGPGDREIIRRFSSAFPNVVWHVFYDEDFSRQDDLLSLAYEDLGSLADTTEFIAADTASDLPIVDEYAHTTLEIQAIANAVAHDVQNGIAPAQIAILTGPNEFEPLARQLAWRGLGHTCLFDKPCRDVLPQPDRFSQNKMDFDARTSEAFLAKNKLQALDEAYAFAKRVFKNLLSPDAEQTLGQLAAESRKAAQYRSEANLRQIVIAPFSDGHALQNRKLYGVGLQIESFLIAPESGVLHEADLKLKDWAEALALPSYRFKIQIENLKRLIAYTPDIQLSRSRNDLSGRPTTELPFLKSAPVVFSVQKANPQTWHAERPVQTSKSISVSALQKYQDCPYKYYAAYELKLSEPELVEPDISAKAQGLLLHSILHALQSRYKSQLHEYLKGVFSAQAWQDLVFETADQLANQHSEIAKLTEKMRQPYLTRLRQTILHLHKQEKEWFEAGQKVTLPEFSEWPFECQIGKAKIKGRIDRIDVSPDQNFATVVDYKSGQAPSATDVKQARHLQMAVYMMALQQQFPNYQLSAGLYYSFKNETWSKFVIDESADAGISKKQFRVNTEDWQETQNTTLLVINTIIDNIQNGVFAPQPREEALCQSCGSRRICPRFV